MSLSDDISLIAKRRKNLGWSQQELAERSGVSKSSIERIEDGKSLRKSTILQVERALAAGENQVSNLQTDRRLKPYLDLLRYHVGKVYYSNLTGNTLDEEAEIGGLFVEPRFSQQLLSPGRDPAGVQRWTLTKLIDQLAFKRQVTVLGDPGSGKTTLLNWIAYSLAGPWHWLHEKFPGLVPVLVPVREMQQLTPDLDWDSFLDELHSTTVCGRLQKSEWEPVAEAIEKGQALVLIDGLDEHRDEAVRRSLRSMIEAQASTRDGNAFLLTSRVVGFDLDGPKDIEKRPSIRATYEAIGIDFDASIHLSTARPPVFYVAPFDDEQIDAFARNWWGQRIASAIGARQAAAEFTEAVRASPSTLLLGRVPNLLTMMAIVYRQNSQLPDGRIHLYTMIVDAYLERIDNYRKIKANVDSLFDKKRWLGEVAFAMMERRDNNDGGILIDREDLYVALSNAMFKRGANVERKEVVRFVDYLALRTGLMLERAPDKFGFVHLSVQEYFAGWHLSRGLLRTRDRLNVDWLGVVQRRLADDNWLETIVFFFEVVGREQKESLASVLDEALGDAWSRGEPFADSEKKNTVVLARLARDSEGVMEPADRPLALDSCCRWAVRAASTIHGGMPQEVFAALFGGNAYDLPEIWSNFWKHSKESQGLDFSGTVLTDAGAATIAEACPNRTWLNLCGTQVADVGAAAIATGCPNLNSLDLSGTQVTDAGAAAIATGCPNLTAIDLSLTQVTDAGAAAIAKGCPNLTAISLSDTQVTDVGAAAIAKGCSNLTVITLGHTQVTDVGAAAIAKGCLNLSSINLTSTQVSDIGAAAIAKGCSNLTKIALWRTQVTDVGAAAIAKGCSNLTVITLGHTQVTDVGAAAIAKGCLNLSSLDLSFAQVTDVGAAAIAKGCLNLTSLNLWHTQVTDVGAAAIAKGCLNLTSLNLWNTEVSAACVAAMKTLRPNLAILR